MSDEIYEIQWLAETPYLVYMDLNTMDDYIVIELTDAQKEAVNLFYAQQRTAEKRFCESLIDTPIN